MSDVLRPARSVRIQHRMAEKQHIITQCSITRAITCTGCVHYSEFHPLAGPSFTSQMDFDQCFSTRDRKFLIPGSEISKVRLIDTDCSFKPNMGSSMLGTTRCIHVGNHSVHPCLTALPPMLHLSSPWPHLPSSRPGRAFSPPPPLRGCTRSPSTSRTSCTAAWRS